MLPIFICLISTLLASHVSATTIAHRSIHQLLTRQSTFDPSEIPAECTNRCAIFVSTIQTCSSSTDPACGCTLAGEKNDVDCLNCILYSGGVTPTETSIQSIQAEVDKFVQACNLDGVSLPATTLSGEISGLTSTFAPNSLTSVNSPTSAAADPVGTQSASGTGLGGTSGNKNSGSRAQGTETVVAAAAVAAVLVVFF
ncbi:hypothetical protein H2248_002188 [Termitomyces sp. 'cryptogamus']|nr:hypothetical protein H2248_002188 [Termitomyces sp. 'cryptogamus']